MTDLQQKLKGAWTSARAGVTAAEQEAEKVLSKLADAARLSPEDVRRHARELSERLTGQRRELERAIDETVKRAVTRFKIPTRDDIDALRKRLDTISDRLDALSSKDKGAA